jgi:hypothetical protein
VEHVSGGEGNAKQAGMTGGEARRKGANLVGGELAAGSLPPRWSPELATEVWVARAEVGRVLRRAAAVGNLCCSYWASVYGPRD